MKSRFRYTLALVVFLIGLLLVLWWRARSGVPLDFRTIQAAMESPQEPAWDFIPLGIDSEREKAHSGGLWRSWDERSLKLFFKVYDEEPVFAGPDMPNPEVGDQIRLFLDLREERHRGRYPYEKGVWHLRLTPDDGTDTAAITSLGNGSRFAPGERVGIDVRSEVGPSGWMMAIGIPWRALDYRPKVGATLGFGFSVLDQRRDATVAVPSLGLAQVSGGPRSDPGYLDDLDLITTQPAPPPGLFLVAEETVLNGEVYTHLQLVRFSDDPRFTDTEVRVSGLPGAERLSLRPSAGGRFLVGESYLAESIRQPPEARNILFSGVDDNWSHGIRVTYPIASMRNKIELRLPESSLVGIDDDRLRLAGYLKQMAVEVTEQMTLERSETRARQRQLRFRHNPNFYTAAIEYLLAWAERVRDGNAPPSLLDRLHVWRSQLDGSLQLLRIVLPVGYTAKGSFPVTFDFHGAVDDTLRYRQAISLLQQEDAGRNSARSGESVVLYLGGRGNQSQTLGEEEFLRAWRLARMYAKEDKPALTIRGGSKGASDGLIYALRYPDKVSGVDLRSGYYASEFARVKDATENELRVLKLLYGVESQVSRLRFIEGRLAAGTKDEGSVDATLSLGEMLKAVGSQIVTDIQAEGSHSSVSDMPALSPPIGSRPRRTPDLANGLLDHAETDALAVLQLERFGEPWSCRVRGGGDPQKLVVETRNVRRLQLKKSPDAITPRLRFITVDSTVLPLREYAALNLEKNNGIWRVANGLSDTMAKIPLKSGPMFSVRQGKFLLIVGTQDPVTKEAIRARAWKIARELTAPSHGAGLRLEIKNDDDASDEDLRGNSLWLIGGPAENSVYSRLKLEPPFKISPREVRIGDRLHMVNTPLFLNFIQPHPAGGTYVYAEIATAAAGYFAPVMPNREFDYSILRIDLRTNPLVCRGFFDENWSYRPELEFNRE